MYKTILIDILFKLGLIAILKSTFEIENYRRGYLLICF